MNFTKTSGTFSLDTVIPDFFHLQIALAARNRHYSDLMTFLGSTIIPRTRLKRAHEIAAPVLAARIRKG